MHEVLHYNKTEDMEKQGEKTKLFTNFMER